MFPAHQSHSAKGACENPAGKVSEVTIVKVPSALLATPLRRYYDCSKAYFPIVNKDAIFILKCTTHYKFIRHETWR